MPDKAVISHRGEKYEIGRGKRFYGIWVIGAPYDAPLDRWPENRDGWLQAWSRFAALEQPAAISAVTRERAIPWLGPGLRRLRGEAAGDGAAARSRPRRGATMLVGEGLLVLGVVLGLAGLFPAYVGSQSLLSQSYQVVPHLFYVIGWALSAALIALSVARPGTARLGALFGLGLGVVTFGLFLADVGEVTSGVSIGTGLVVSLIGWFACTAGSAFALRASTGQAGQASQPNRPVRPDRGQAGQVALLALAGIGTAAAFAPSWDSYTLTFSALGTSQTITAGNAFDNPGVMIAGNVAVMVAIVVVAAVAALWRPARQGALLLAGAIVVLVAQAISALIQAGQPVSPALFGISPAQASATGLTISTSVTPIFWVFFVFVISLLVSCAWLFTEPGRPAMPGIMAAPWPPYGGVPTDQDPATRATTDTAVSDDADSDASDDDPDWAAKPEAQGNPPAQESATQPSM